MNITRWIFAISLLLGFFWVFGFILEAVNQKDPSIITLSAISISVTLLFCSLLFKVFPQFLKEAQDTNISILKYYIVNIIVSYFLLIPVFGALTYILILSKDGSEVHEAGIAIALVSIWFPLWWFIPVGLSLGWYLYKRKCAL